MLKSPWIGKPKKEPGLAKEVKVKSLMNKLGPHVEKLGPKRENVRSFALPWCELALWTIRFNLLFLTPLLN